MQGRGVLTWAVNGDKNSLTMHTVAHAVDRCSQDAQDEADPLVRTNREPWNLSLSGSCLNQLALQLSWDAVAIFFGTTTMDDKTLLISSV